MNNEQHTKKSDEQLNELFDAIVAISFDEARKNLIKDKLAFFVDTHPIETVSPMSPAPSPFFSRAVSFSVFGRNKYIFAGALLLCLVVGGTSFAAQQALPGNPLYAVKTLVNEPIVAFFSIGPKSEAVADASQALSRLSEAEQLSVANELTTSTQDTVKTGFSVAAQKVVGAIAQLNASGDSADASEVQSNFVHTLAQNHAVLIQLSQENKNESNLLTDLAQDVNIHLMAVASTIATSTATTTPANVGNVGIATTTDDTTATTTVETNNTTDISATSTAPATVQQ